MQDKRPSLLEWVYEIGLDLFVAILILGICAKFAWYIWHWVVK